MQLSLYTIAEGGTAIIAALPSFYMERKQMMQTKTAAVSIRNVTKTFGSVIANDKVNLDIYKGEILALLGENGSGKTTLMNMLAGIYFPDEGQIYINGKEEVIKSPRDAFNLGIGMVHQHFKLIDVLSATENIILGLEGKLDIKEASRKIEEICTKYGFDVDPKQKIYDMSVSQKQTVEIVKVLYRGADILILDGRSGTGRGFLPVCTGNDILHSGEFPSCDQK